MLKRHKQNFQKNKKVLRQFLKKFDKKYIQGINKLVEETDKETWESINCLDCGNCCKTMTPTFTPQDIKRISAHFKMSPTEFYNKWLQTDKDNGDKVNKVQPCQFLNLTDNKCSIYAIRPEDCAKFPHFKRKPFGDFNHIHTQNIEYCPATLKFITNLKQKIEKDYVW